MSVYVQSVTSIIKLKISTHSEKIILMILVLFIKINWIHLECVRSIMMTFIHNIKLLSSVITLH